MKTLRLFFLAAVLTMSTNLIANPVMGDNPGIVPGELQELLTAPDLAIEKDITVVVKFSLNEEREIRVYSVNSENEQVNEYFRSQLEKKKLTDKKWHTKKLYEVPVRVEAKR